MRKLVLSIFISVSLLVAFAGSCFDIDINPDKNEGTEQTSKNEEPPPKRQSISIDSFNAVVQAAHFIIQPDFSFTISLPDASGNILPATCQGVLIFTSYHKTLFRQIISPNAP